MMERTRSRPGVRPAHQEHEQQAQQAADRIGEAVRFPIEVARRVLPERELPVYLTVGALAVAGVIEWPLAAAAGLGYAALRRWGGDHRQSQQPDAESRAHRNARVRADGEVTSTRRPIMRR